MIESIVLSEVFPFLALFESFINFLVKTRLSSCSFYLFIRAYFTHPPICSTHITIPSSSFHPHACSWKLFLSCLAFSLLNVPPSSTSLSLCLHLCHSWEELPPQLVSFRCWSKRSRREIKVSEEPDMIEIINSWFSSEQNEQINLFSFVHNRLM